MLKSDNRTEKEPTAFSNQEIFDPLMQQWKKKIFAFIKEWMSEGVTLDVKRIKKVWLENAELSEVLFSQWKDF